MKKRLMSMVLFLMFTAIPMANASIVLEPILGYHVTGKYDMGLQTGTLSGSEIGGRVAYSFLGLQAGLELRKVFYSMSATTLSVPTSKFGAGDLGLYVGYQLPILFRVYGALVIGGEGSTDNVNLSYGKVSGYRIGASFTGLPFVMINFEYRNVSYSQQDSFEVKSNLTNKLNTNSVMASVSLPFSI